MERTTVYRLRYITALAGLTVLGIVMHFLMHSRIRDFRLTGALDTVLLHQLGYGFLLVALVVIVVMEFYVFSPMIRQIRKDMAYLEGQRKELELYHQHLEALVQEKTRKLEESNQLMKDLAAVYREEKDKFSAVLESTPDALVISDRQGIIRMVNSQMEKTFGYSRLEIVGQSLEMLIPERFRQKHHTYHQKFIECPEMWPDVMKRRVLGKRKDGFEISLEIGLSPLQTSEGLLVIASLRDVSERDRIEEELRIRREHELLQKEMTIVSEREQQQIGRELHDGLGQQLTGIALQAQVLAKSLESKNLGEMEAAQRLSRFASEAIQEARRLSHGLAFHSIETKGLATAIEELLAHFSSTAGVSCQLRAEDPLPPMGGQVLVHLYRIVQEAANNAIRHGHAKNLWVRIRKLKGRLLVSISDDGQGLPVDFEKMGGMGIRIMNYRTAELKGKLSVHASAQGGTEVTVDLPESPSGFS